MGNNMLGPVGENKAAGYLKRKGYKILDRNFRCRMGEIDIVAQKDGYVVFVEVKARKDASFAEAREFVTYAKQQRILKTAMFWLHEHDSQFQPRFDVIEVYPSGSLLEPYRINHIENAFM